MQHFLERLEDILQETRTSCYAWALIPNRFHLLLRTGDVPISRVMKRFLTGYAVWYNLRYHRRGHLFQNRFKPILCQEDVYLLELVRHIHLNPMRARLVEDLNGLSTYEYCGHSAVLGKIKRPWQDTQWVLGMFAKTVGQPDVPTFFLLKRELNKAVVMILRVVDFYEVQEAGKG